ncbi:hypothetical protein [Geodermatophilus sp. SYSU D00815]
MLIARRVGAALIAVAAVAIWFLMAPEDPEPITVKGVADRSAQIDQALSDYELNDISASSAPQQQVVNGWVAKDLLTIMAEQQNEALARDTQLAAPAATVDERIPALGVLVVLGVALALVTSTRGATAARADGEARREPTGGGVAPTVTWASDTPAGA